MAEEEGKPAIRKTVGRFLLRLVGLFHIGFGPYWFVQEIGILGRIGRWDIAITMALLTVLGFLLLLRPSCWAGLLTALVYAAWMIFQRFIGLGEARSIVLYAFVAFIACCALLATDSRSKPSDRNSARSCVSDGQSPAR